MNYIKNPIVIGLLALAVTYGYLYWENTQKYNKTKKNKKNNISLLIPGAVGAFAWFIASTYFDNDTNISINKIKNINSQPVKPSYPNKINMELSQETVNDSGSFGSGSYKVLDKDSTKLPNMDLFLDIMSDGF